MTGMQEAPSRAGRRQCVRQVLVFPVVPVLVMLGVWCLCRPVWQEADPGRWQGAGQTVFKALFALSLVAAILAALGIAVDRLLRAGRPRLWAARGLTALRVPLVVGSLWLFLGVSTFLMGRPGAVDAHWQVVLSWAMVLAAGVAFLGQESRHARHVWSHIRRVRPVASADPAVQADVDAGTGQGAPHAAAAPALALDSHPSGWRASRTWMLWLCPVLFSALAIFVLILYQTIEVFVMPAGPHVGQAIVAGLVVMMPMMFTVLALGLVALAALGERVPHWVRQYPRGGVLARGVLAALLAGVSLAAAGLLVWLCQGFMPWETAYLAHGQFWWAWGLVSAAAGAFLWNQWHLMRRMWT